MSYKLEMYINIATVIVIAISTAVGAFVGQSMDVLTWKILSIVGFGTAAFAWKNCIEMIEANSK